MRKTKFIILLFASALSNASFAAANQPRKPSATFWALGGEQVIGRGQGVIPFGGDGVNSTFYGAIEAAGSFKKSNGYATGIAAGYRNIINNSYILGGYLFADYNRSPAGHDFLVANPGLEVLGNIWDFRINGYIPMPTHHWTGNEELAENLGITQFEKALGHDRYDHLVQKYEEAGSGFDAEVGKSIPITKALTLKAYVGGYHYFMNKTDKITGIESRIVYPLSNYVSLEARDSYDKVRKNIFMAGIRFTFGGHNSEDKDSLGVTGRLADPIEHNFGNFAAANSVAVGTAYLDKGIEYHLPGAFWYFDNAINSIGDGSYEHPFNAIDPRAYQLMTNSGALSQNVQMYVATGTAPYDLSSMPEHRLTLLNDYSIYGRTAHFTLAAKNYLRPELDGGITATGNNHNINDIQLKSQNDGFTTVGALYLSEAANVKVNDVSINVFANSAEAVGISMMNSSATISNSVVTVSSTAAHKQSTGINTANSTLLIGNDNYIKAVITAPDDQEVDAIGIIGVGGKVEIFGNNNQIIAAATGHGSRAGGVAHVGTTIISGNNNKIFGSATGEEGDAFGIGAIANSKIIADDNKQIIISGNNNQIIANSEKKNSIGIMNVGGTLIISGNNNQIIANSAIHVAPHLECNAGGIVNSNNGTITISGYNNQIIAKSPYIAYGIFLVDPPTTSSALNIQNTIFNVATTAKGTAAGINMGYQRDVSTMILKNNIFNVSAVGISSKAYGIYLPHATTPAPDGNIAANIFNITNSNAPLNAWGVYANANWNGAVANWIRAHNIWFNPTLITPQQQVHTGNTGFINDYLDNEFFYQSLFPVKDQHK